MEQHQDHLRQEGHGMLKPGNTLHLRWNSQVYRTFLRQALLE